MKLNRLRIVGFKTFVEPSEFLIEPGLTGVVGPNGCGKSNLVEALRWVMGENSYKSLRASGMDDVIFGGSNARPARNNAEVMLTIDNSARTAPAHFNDHDLLEVSRKITRDAGSVYRVNGREVRARDVQLLFADAATGARSHAMVRQGQIGEIISAKPQARRRILEDAAGIAGLHSRRHEAELRLRAAEDNLQRLEDIMREIDSQVEGLRKQARHAGRYKALSSEIRQCEAITLLINWENARQHLGAMEEACRSDEEAVAKYQEQQAQAAYKRGLAAHTLTQARTAADNASLSLQQRIQEKAELGASERRMRDRAADTVRRIDELERDLVREQAQMQDARSTTARLKDEDTILEERLSGSESELAEAAGYVTQTLSALELADANLSQLRANVAEITAKRAALERQIQHERARHKKLINEHNRVTEDIEKISRDMPLAGEVPLLREEVETLELADEAAEDRSIEARRTLALARENESVLRKPFNDADSRLKLCEAEVSVLSKRLIPVTDDNVAALFDMIHVSKGYEKALGAVLGDDLLASLDPKDPMHWVDPGRYDEDPALPAGTIPLSTVVNAPAALSRRLRMIGIVEREAGTQLQEQLSPGQRLVTCEGDVWRWDGFVCAAETPTAASRRLEEQNRLADLEQEAEAARVAFNIHQHKLDEAHQKTLAAASEEMQALDAQQASRRALEAGRLRFLAAERAVTSVAARRAALDEAHARLNEAQAQTHERIENLNLELEELAGLDHGNLDLVRSYANQARVVHKDAEQALQNLQRDVGARLRRRDTIAAELHAWDERSARAASILSDIEERILQARDLHLELTESAEELALQDAGMAAIVMQAQEAVSLAGKAHHESENALAAVDSETRQALDMLATAREARARSMAMVEMAHEKLNHYIRKIADDIGIKAENLRAHLKVDYDYVFPDQQEIEGRLIALRNDRSRLGAVNLRAEEELIESQEKRDSINGEHSELVEAIRRLRQAITNLNREGRERLMNAFSIVNGHFQRLFTSLFGGGTADLSFIDSDDPLEAGLEIYARPPGKKPQVLTLLSGGEQALTAIALIFAVFLTNPSPVCVLDEVDAPLDDANVERYCGLLRTMAEQTETRFIVITHNPITMAAVDRLFGVTMAEKGISQLVSVDLERAERILDI